MIATVFENLATNPSFETASGTVTVRTNYATNTLNGANSTGVSAIGLTLSLQSGFVRGTVSDGAATSQRFQSSTVASGVTVAPGEVWTVQAQARTSSAFGAKLTVSFFRSDGTTFISTANGAEGPIAGSAFVAVPPLTVTVPALAAKMTWVVISTTGARATSDTFDVRKLMIEPMIVALPPFDGSTPAAGDFTYAWSGTVDASTSVQQGAGVAGVTSAVAVSVQSSGWSSAGTKSVRTIPVGASNASVTYPAGTSGMTLGMQAGKTYTALVKCRLAAPLTGALHAQSRRIVMQYSDGSYSFLLSDPAPNTAGVHDLRLTFTLPAGTTIAFFYLINGAYPGGGDVWWDDLLVVEGEYTGDYFDGDTTSSDTSVYTWTGTAHASTSRHVAFLYGANLTIGRFGTDVIVDSVAQWDEQGDRVTVSGQTPFGSVPDALTLRQQLMGYVDSPDETFVPVTWADQPSVNGFYRVVSARVDPSKAGAFVGVFLFSVELVRVQGFTAPLIECIALGKLRTTPLTLTQRPTQAIPAGGKSYVEYHPEERVLIPRGVDIQRSGETSVLSVFSAFANDYIVGQFYLPVVRFYEGAATVRVGGRVIAGRQASNTPTDWQLTNDLLQVEPVAGTDFAIRIRMWNSGAWSPWTTATIKWASAGATRAPMKFPHTVTILANAPEQVTVRLLSTTGGDYSPVSVDITMRRGARGVSVDLRSVFESDFAVNLTGFTSTTALTGGHSKTTSGVTTFIGSAKTISVSSGDVYPNQDLIQFVTEFSFGVGLTNSLETAQTLLNEYFWAGSEKQSVVAR